MGSLGWRTKLRLMEIPRTLSTSVHEETKGNLQLLEYRVEC
jgi:hypothetical protein